MAIPVKLEVFEGPLDLLLHLISQPHDAALAECLLYLPQCQFQIAFTRICTR